MSTAPPKSWLEVVALHPDVLAVNFSEDIFALDLGPLADGLPSVPAVYRDAENFLKRRIRPRGSNHSLAMCCCAFQVVKAAAC